MKISIITATKNNKNGLIRAIECVRKQTYQNIEHIIVDGGSTDGTVETIKNEQLKFKNLSPLTTNYSLPTTNYSLIAISEADSGIYDAINKGIKLATGEVIGLLHSDDLYADDKVLARYAEVFERAFDFAQGNRIDAVYSDLVYVRRRQEVRSEKSDSGQVGMTELKTTDYSLLTTNYSTIRYWKAHVDKIDSGSSSGMTNSGYRSLITNQLIKLGWMPPHPTLFIRKEIFDKYGLYNTEFKIASDYEMILRLFWKHKITPCYLPLTTYLMMIGGASNKSIKNILQKSKEDLRALKMNGINFPILTLISKNFRKLPQFLARDLS